MKPRTKNTIKGARRHIPRKSDEAAGKIAAEPGAQVKGRLQKEAYHAQRSSGAAEYDYEKDLESDI